MVSDHHLVIVDFVLLARRWLKEHLPLPLYGHALLLQRIQVRHGVLIDADLQLRVEGLSRHLEVLDGNVRRRRAGRYRLGRSLIVDTITVSDGLGHASAPEVTHLGQRDGQGAVMLLSWRRLLPVDA